VVRVYFAGFGGLVWYITSNCEGREDILILVDTSIGAGNNRIYGSSGDDEIFAGADDRLFGGTGNTIFKIKVFSKQVCRINCRFIILKSTALLGFFV